MLGDAVQADATMGVELDRDDADSARGFERGDERVAGGRSRGQQNAPVVDDRREACASHQQRGPDALIGVLGGNDDERLAVEEVGVIRWDRGVDVASDLCCDRFDAGAPLDCQFAIVKHRAPPFRAAC